MGLFIAAWFCPVICAWSFASAASGAGMAAALTEMGPQMFEIGFFGCLLVAVYAVINLFMDGDALEELLSPSGALARLAQIGAIVNLLLAAGGFFLSPYADAVGGWARSNGAALNCAYVAILLATAALNWKAHAVGRKGKTALDAAAEENGKHTQKFAQMRLIAFVLFLPTVVIYTFNGAPGGYQSGTLAPLPISEWVWSYKLTLAAFGLTLLKYLVLEGAIKRNRAVWRTLAAMANAAVGCFVFVVLERFLVSLITSGVFYTALNVLFTLIDGALIYLSYLFILFCAMDLLSFGAYSEAVEERRRRERYEALTKPVNRGRKEYEEKLDARERALNAAAGRGPFTDEEAFIMGREGGDEYATSSLYREQKLDRYDEKHPEK